MERGGVFDNDEEYESEEDVKNDEWFKDNYIDLIEEHPREWIAVMDQTIIATGATRIEVEDKAKVIAGEHDYSVYFVNPTATVTDTAILHDKDDFQRALCRFSAGSTYHH